MKRFDGFVLGLHRVCLRLAPREFRARYGAELLDCATRALADARCAAGGRTPFVAGLRSAVDVGLSALLLSARTPGMRKTLLLLPLVLLASFGTAWVDAHQDEVQPAALLLLLAGALFAFLDARRAWLWWLLLGASVPGARLWLELHGQALGQGPFAGTLLAFVPAGLGVLFGFGLSVARGRKPSAGASA